MKALSIVVVSLLLVFHGEHIIAQQDSIAMRYANTITPDELKEHLFILAGDEFKGRDTGSEDMRRAAEYLINEYKSIGVPPCIDGSYIQSYPLKRMRFGASTITNAGKVYEFKKDFYTFGGFDKTTIGDTKVVFAGYGITTEGYDDYAGIDVKDAIVMCIMGEPMDPSGNSIFTGNTNMSEWSDDFRLKRDLAMKRGAKAVLFIESNFDYIVQRIGYFLDQPRMSLDYPNMKEEDENVIPYFFISPAMGDAILKSGKMKPFAELAKKIAKKKRAYSKALKTSISADVIMEKEKIEGENVLCFIEGSDPELSKEVVVISAHFDHVGVMGGKIYNGADDDGSGTVTAMEIAKAFQQAKLEGHGARRSILVLHVSGEEKGLLGSEWYSENPVFPLKHTVCDLNIDMIGRVDDAHKDNEKYVYVIGSDKLSTELHDISEKTNGTYTNLELDYTYNDPNDPNKFYYRSDHYNFAKHDIPVIFYFSGVHEDYHQPGDDPEKIMYNKMSEIGKLIFYTAWNVANRDKKLVVDVMNDFKD